MSIHVRAPVHDQIWRCVLGLGGSSACAIAFALSGTYVACRSLDAQIADTRRAFMGAHCTARRSFLGDKRLILTDFGCGRPDLASLAPFDRGTEQFFD